MWTLWLLSHAVLATFYLDLIQLYVRLLEVELGMNQLQHVF